MNLYDNTIVNAKSSATVQKDKKTSINFPLITWWNSILTIAIIAIRAFQPNAERMSDWSVNSWFWMTMPIWLSTCVSLLSGCLLLLLWIWANIRNNY